VQRTGGAKITIKGTRSRVHEREEKEGRAEAAVKRWKTICSVKEKPVSSSGMKLMQAHSEERNSLISPGA